MDDSSLSYTVSRLICELRELKGLEQNLPPIGEGDMTDDPAVIFGVNVYLRRRMLRERPDVSRFLAHFSAAQLGRDDDPDAVEAFVLQVWQRQCPQRDPHDFGELSLDEFSKLVEQAVADDGRPRPPLSVDLKRKTIALEGVEYDVGSDLALRWMKVLAEHPGEWIAGPDLKTHDDMLDGTRTNRLRQYLPHQIASLIDSETGKGSRINLA